MYVKFDGAKFQKDYKLKVVEILIYCKQRRGLVTV
jgi:hypothetical protein